MTSTQEPYPKPGSVGGRLIRQVVCFLRSQGVQLPFTSHILIALSGGPDSMALAHLLLKYGRRIVNPERIVLLHVDHQWRDGSIKDVRFVRAFAREWGVPLRLRSLKGPTQNEAYQGQSWEEVGRQARLDFFQKMAKHYNGTVLTAHQADDLAETLLWRLFTGAAMTHGGGIVFSQGHCLKPLLGVRKKDLISYLTEEAQPFLTDPTNNEGRFLRSRLRKEIFPSIEKLFPRAVAHLVQAGLDAQQSSAHVHTDEDPAFVLFRAAQIKDRRAHWKALQKGQNKLSLPGGWILTRKVSRKGGRDSATQQTTESWLLERITDRGSECS